jgi:hypothetical protein
MRIDVPSAALDDTLDEAPDEGRAGDVQGVIGRALTGRAAGALAG